MHVERAAPRPVPVQIRIPRLYSVEVLETPANWTERENASQGKAHVKPTLS